MTTKIEQVNGREILDSRGRPTVWARCRLASGAVGSASVPSGASTGAAEAHELRDGDAARYGGLGCRRAVESINGELNRALAGVRIEEQIELDKRLIECDGTSDKSRLGANALLAVSIAFARATADQRGVPLYVSLSEEMGTSPQRLPRPTINLFSGGKHAGGQVAIQDVLIVPAVARTIDEVLSTTFAVYERAAEQAQTEYGMRRLRADEGGLAPPFPTIEAMLEAAVEAIRAAQYEPGRDVALAIDVAASHFYHDGHYVLGNETLDSEAMIARIARWVEQYPIVSVEDGLAEDDWAAWPMLREAIGERARVVGDDLRCTQTARIERAIESRAADTLLLKVNQVGTLSEAAEAYRRARSAGWQVTVSARSGETEDDWLADLAVGWGGDQIKVGSITQSERLAKYNRLLAIEGETAWPVVDWP